MRHVFVFLMICAFTVLSFAEPIEPRIVGFSAIPFFAVPEADEVVDALTGSRSDLFYGIGWEVIVGQIGIGGNYGVNFVRDDSYDWTVEWYAEALFVSFHLFGAGAFIDPFAQAGIGCAGSVFIDDASIAGPGYTVPLDASDILTIGIFPYASLGCAFNLRGLVLGAKLNYTPFVSPPPVTNFDAYPLKRIQAVVFLGISLGPFGDDTNNNDCDCDCECDCR